MNFLVEEIVLRESEPREWPEAVRQKIAECGSGLPALKEVREKKFLFNAKRLPAKWDAPAETRWTFDNGVPPDFKLCKGDVRFRERRGAQPAALVVAEHGHIVFTRPAPPMPFKVSFVLEALDEKKMPSFGMGWTDGVQTFSASRWKKEVTISNPKRVSAEVFFVDRFVVNVLDGDVGTVVDYQLPNPADYVFLSPARAAVTEITMKTLTPAEIPAALRNPLSLIKQMTTEKQPIGRSTLEEAAHAPERGLDKEEQP